MNLQALFSDDFIQVAAFPFMLMFGLLAISNSLQELFRVMRGMQSYTWKATPARLTRREVVFEKGDETADYYRIRVDYTYQIGQKTYTAHRIAIGIGEYHHQEAKAQTILEQYLPSQDTLTVYVNPRQPKQATIHRGRNLDSFLKEVFWILFFVLCSASLYLIYQRV